MVILAGLAIALAAAYAVLKELLFEPAEYAVFGTLPRMLLCAATSAAALASMQQKQSRQEQQL